MTDADWMDWIARAKRRGQAPALLTLLDAIEPLVPLLAQSLWVAQPLAGLWNGAPPLGALAELLEDRQGIERLRQRLMQAED